MYCPYCIRDSSLPSAYHCHVRRRNVWARNFITPFFILRHVWTPDLSFGNLTITPIFCSRLLEFKWEKGRVRRKSGFKWKIINFEIRFDSAKDWRFGLLKIDRLCEESIGLGRRDKVICISVCLDLSTESLRTPCT